MISPETRSVNRRPTDVQRLRFNVALAVDALTSWLPQKSPVEFGLAGGVVLTAGGALIENFSGRTAIGEAAKPCTIQLFGMGFHYAKDPERVGNLYLIDPYSFVVPGLPDFGEVLITVKEDPKKADSPKKVIPYSMSPKDDHFEARFNITENSNTEVGSAPALEYEVSMKDDLVIDPRTKEKPKKTFTVRCGKTGWFYVGRVAIDSAIDGVAKSTIAKLDRVGTRIDQITLKALGVAPGAAPANDNPAENLKVFKANIDQIKKNSKQVKDKEMKDGGKTSTSTSMNPPQNQNAELEARVKQLEAENRNNAEQIADLTSRLNQQSENNSNLLSAGANVAGAGTVIAGVVGVVYMALKRRGII